ncbi:Eco57I restriction-modification methylase domain-containing protein [Halorubrum sp. Hd13]|uniref:Eco57I restriction-modification methylase domain-containing protein n=1 Tax=Halorubrum sp. Hd13 TaxID=1480728 RepID=UPI000B97D885|nr:DNA methyltransferase [Halorubrum sp. Hd13]OYR38633.1 type II restriction endonuclease subunit M [Halorubrum sp. Hd13]
MTLQQITADDIAGWNSLDAVASSFEKRGLKPRPNLGDANELVLQLTDTEFIVLVEAGPGESASDFKPDNRNRRTNLVATNDYEEFTFLTRVRSWEGQQHGRIKHQKLSFTKEQMTSESGEKNTVLQKLNSIEYGSADAIQDTLYDTKQVVKEFYQQFEQLRTDLVQEVSGIPDDRGDAKQRYVQIVLDRMIFLYFIQEKRLLDRNVDYLHEKHRGVAGDGGDVYDDFYHPLFFDMLAEGKQDPDFGSLPYLNGGLFSENPVEDEFDDVKLGESAEQTNELFGDILDFLSDWNWNVDERLDVVDPKNLSPAILGHIFEQTVNQKEMGAYYTPEEITGFMARQTIHPYLLDELNEAVDADYAEIDDVFGFAEAAADTQVEALADGGSVTAQVPIDNVETRHVETLYHDILTEIHVLDPAVGSGAFLLAAQEVLLDIYMQCIEFFQQLESNGKGWELENRTRDVLEEVEDSHENVSLYSKRAIILNNLYGVDLDDGAVEICKLRLWLSMVADIEDEPSEVEPLPNIDFNIRHGNSLIGFTQLVEIAREEQGDASLANYGVGESVREMYDDVIEAVERHRNATSASVATNARRLAESRIKSHSESLNQKILEEFHEAGIEGIDAAGVDDLQPFHWVLEFATVYRGGGFDIVIGNPPWEELKPYRDDFFIKHDTAFRSYTPEQRDERMEELLENEEVAQGWQEFQHSIEQRAQYINESDEYRLQSPSVANQQVARTNDLSLLFFERIYSIVRDGGYVSQILPGPIFNAAAGKDLRVHALENSEVKHIIGFENHGIFNAIDNRYNFGIITFQQGGSTNNVRGVFHQTSVDVLRNIDEVALDIPVRTLKEYSPGARIFPNVEEQREVSVLDTILQHPPVADELNDRWRAVLYKELDRGRDRDRFVENESLGDYPVYQGKNIYQFCHDEQYVRDLAPISLWSVDEDEGDKSAKARVRLKNFRARDPNLSLKKAIYTEFSDNPEFAHISSNSQKQFVNTLLSEEFDRPELSEEDVLLHSTEYRLVIREVARATDERTLIAAIIPPGGVVVHTLYTVRPYETNPTKENLGDYPMHSAYERVFSDKELFVALGLLNSVVFDFLMRTKVDSHASKYKFEESQIPRLTHGDDWFHYIANRAARLNCYGEAFAEMRERLGGVEPATEHRKRRELQAEIDAAAFHAYGLGRRDVKFVLDDFHRVSNPRIMTEEYFDMVFEKFDTLAEEGPHA